jgi:hypothetical protein
LDKTLESNILNSLVHNETLDKDALAIEYGTTVNEISRAEAELCTNASKKYIPPLNEISKLIGEHPKSKLFSNWCKFEDINIEPTKKYRKLTDKGINRDSLIEQLADWIIEHHTSPKQLKRFEKKKSILLKHEFKQYVEERMPFPINNFTTQKGNLGEIILAEYLKSSSELELLIYKFRFNPNVEQSMKGDDILLFDKDNIKDKIIMGESKYRTTPDKSVIEDIMKALSKDNLPISLTFVRDRLDELDEEDTAEQIDDLISEIYKQDVPIVYVGFIHSNHNIENHVKRHFNSDNENLVLISYGEKNPTDLIKKSFDKAIEKITS